MALFIASLNSGSNGNCYYIGNDREAILVDIGISCTETEKRMKAIGLSMKMVRAIFISHEHTDHIKGVSTLANKYKIPVYITPATARDLKLIRHLSTPFIADEPISVGALNVTAFRKYHDAADPHSFIISCNGITVGVFTDIGHACDKVTAYFSRCHAAFLETNYDEELLEKGRYPLHLKNRIRGDQGHLSNDQALELFKSHRPPFMSHLLLSHLSKDNNDPELAKKIFMAAADHTTIIVASRYAPTPIYTIDHPDEKGKTGPPLGKPRQLNLF